MQAIDNKISSAQFASQSNEIPFFSIIVPMHNAEKYISESLRSVFNQSFFSIELLVVDDGSTDSSVANCMTLLGEGYEFILLGQEQSGPNVARNLALKHASGKYILFMDADDRLSSSGLELLYSEINKYPAAEVVSFGYIFFDDKTGDVRSAYYPSRRDLRGGDIFLEALIGGDFGGVCWNKCYLHTFLKAHDIFFIPDKIHGRDLIFSRSVALEAREWHSFEVVIYESRFRFGSFSRNFNVDNIRSALDVVDKHIDIFYDAALRRGVLPELYYAIYRHLRYIILLSAFRSKSYYEYYNSFFFVKRSAIWMKSELESGYLFDSIRDRLISIVIKFPRLSWFLANVMKHLNYEPY